MCRARFQSPFYKVIFMRGDERLYTPNWCWLIGYLMSSANKPLAFMDQDSYQTCMYMFGFTNLAQVHNFTISAQDIFIFGSILIFLVRFTEIKQQLESHVMQLVQYSFAIPDSQVDVVKSTSKRMQVRLRL